MPRPVRERFGLLGGPHELEVLETPEGIVLRPRVELISAAPDASGWIVFQSGDPEVVDPVAAIEAERQRRSRSIAGSD